jgi:hypothetical protein
MPQSRAVSIAHQDDTFRPGQPLKGSEMNHLRTHLGKCIYLFGAVFLFFSSTTLLAADAEFENEPYNVCPMQPFDVEWEGPDARGDLIVIANIDAPTEARDFDFAPTSEGDPLTLTAPPAIGEYRVRYIQPGSNALLEEVELYVRECTTCRVREYPVNEYAVAVHGIQSSSGDKVIEHGPIKVRDLCRAGAAVAPIVRDVIGRAGAQLGISSIEIDSQVRNQLTNARESVCSMNEDLGSVNWSTFVYSHCRLAGQSGPYSMDIHLPPGNGDGTMSIADHNERQVMRMTMKRNLQAASAGTGEGWSSGINMSMIGQGSKLGYPTNQYNFDYTMGLGLGGFGEMGQDDMSQIASPQMLGNLVSVKVSGTAHLAQCIPGGNILTEYHERLARELSFDDSSMGAFAGLVKNQVGMLERGIPLDITSKTSGRIAGMPMVMGTDRTIITGFDVVPLPADWCTASLMPDDYEVIDIDQQVNEALSAGRSGSAGGGMTAEQQTQMNDAMRQVNDAMNSMTPEQKAAIENSGLGGLLGGMLGGQPEEAPAATPKPSDQAAQQRRSTPSSRELQGSSLTQTAQNYLQALGFDPGKADGEMSLETIIAISQFQSENGMEVTGEVTPQLIGLLAARVDAN